MLYLLRMSQKLKNINLYLPHERERTSGSRVKQTFHIFWALLKQEQMREMERLTLHSIEICISWMALLCVDLIRKVFKWLLTVQTCAEY